MGLHLLLNVLLTNTVINAKRSYHLQQSSLAQNKLFSFERGQTLGK
jgi:hypothetical protein